MFSHKENIPKFRSTDFFLVTYNEGHFCDFVLNSNVFNNPDYNPSVYLHKYMHIHKHTHRQKEIYTTLAILFCIIVFAYISFYLFNIEVSNYTWF